MGYDFLLEDDVKAASLIAARRGIVPHGDFVPRFLRDELKHVDHVKRDIAIRKKLQKLRAKTQATGSQWFDATGEPTKDHWNLIFLAYSPAPSRFVEWLEGQLAPT
jgi:hypothetical protein